MPIFDLSNEPDIAWQNIAINSLILYPNNDAKRQQFWVRNLIYLSVMDYRNAKKLSPGELDKISSGIGSRFGQQLHSFGGWELLADECITPGKRVPLGEELKQKKHQILTTGFLLRTAIDNNCGIKKAAELRENGWEKLLTEKLDLPEPKLLTKNNPITKAWDQLKSVAHLCAAYTTFDLGAVDIESGHLLPLHKLQPEGLQSFLICAEDYLSKGLSTYPRRGKRVPILNDDLIWRVKI